MTTFALLLVGGDGCWEVLSREPMLRSRIYRRVVFRPFSRRQVLAMVRQYHPLYRDISDELVDLIDDTFAHGNFRSWAAFTRTAQDLCQRTDRLAVDEAVARNVFALHGGIAVTKLACLPHARVVCHPTPGGAPTWLGCDLLLALGKRFDAVQAEHVRAQAWDLAEVWARAEAVEHMFVLRAHALTVGALERLRALQQKTGVRVWLISSRAEPTPRPAPGSW